MSGRGQIYFKLRTMSPELERELGDLISEIEGVECVTRDPGVEPDALLFEVGDDVDNDLCTLSNVIAVMDEVDVFLTSRSSEKHVLLKAMSIGAKEFVEQPIDRAEFIRQVKKYKEAKLGPVQSDIGNRGKVVAFMAAKGGVGVTTLVVHAAKLISEKARSGHQVALLDLPLFHGGLCTAIDCTTDYSFSDLMDNIDRLDREFIYQMFKVWHPGVHVLSSSTSQAISAEHVQLRMNRVLDCLRSCYDTILVDVGYRYDTVSRAMIKLCDEIFLVSEQTLPSLINAKSIVDELSKSVEMPSVREKVRLLVSKASSNGAISDRKFEKAIGMSIEHEFALDHTNVVRALDNGRCVHELTRKSPYITDVRKFVNRFLLESARKPLFGQKKLFRRGHVARANA